MAIADPIKVNQFVVEIDGIDQWAIQEVDRPEISLNQVLHGGGDIDEKTPGKKVVGSATLKHLKPMSGSDTFGDAWLLLAWKSNIGAKVNVVFKEIAKDGITTVNSWMWIGCWPMKLTPTTYNRLADENVIETLELSVDDVIKL